MSPTSDIPPLPPTPEAISGEIDKISSLIAGAEKLVGEHKQVDLVALQGRISALCQALAQLPEGKGIAFKERLENILGQLDTLEKALSAEHESLSSLLEGETRAKSMAAARSYGAGASQTPPDDDGTDGDT